jgi:hypothetical protein
MNHNTSLGNNNDYKNSLTINTQHQEPVLTTPMFSSSSNSTSSSSASASTKLSSLSSSSSLSGLSRTAVPIDRNDFHESYSVGNNMRFNQQK